MIWKPSAMCSCTSCEVGLPWQGLKAATNKQKYEKIGEKKQTTAIKDLCEAFPEEFNQYLSYVRNLGFEDEPDYNYLRDLFTKALKNTGETEDGIYDWMKLNDGKGWEAMKAHPSAAHLHNMPPNSSNREIHRGKPQIPRDRLDADLPKLNQPRNPQVASRGGQRRPGDTTGFASDPALPSKRQSTTDFRHPEGSTTAQFQHSAQNLPSRGSGTAAAGDADAAAGRAQAAGGGQADSLAEDHEGVLLW